MKNTKRRAILHPSQGCVYLGKLAGRVLRALLPAVRAADTPQVGDTAPNFTLRTLDDKTVELKALTARRLVVLVVLRGWYGAQCPICSRQVNDYMTKAADFAAKNKDTSAVVDRFNAFLDSLPTGN